MSALKCTKCGQPYRLVITTYAERMPDLAVVPVMPDAVREMIKLMERSDEYTPGMNARIAAVKHYYGEAK